MSYRDIQIDWLEEIMIPAIDLVYSIPKDRDLIQRKANERTVVANIYCKANSLLAEKQNTTNGLGNLSIDIEYNRNYSDSKRVYEKCDLCQNDSCFIKQRNPQQTVSSPDMIIHQRGSNEDNQVVIEFKKESNANAQEREADRAKLIYFTCQKAFPNHEEENYSYFIGFFIDLYANKYSITTYQDARFIVTRSRQGGA